VRFTRQAGTGANERLQIGFAESMPPQSNTLSQLKKRREDNEISQAHNHDCAKAERERETTQDAHDRQSQTKLLQRSLKRNQHA
jgi:hypothetical protein